MGWREGRKGGRQGGGKGGSCGRRRGRVEEEEMVEVVVGRREEGMMDKRGVVGEEEGSYIKISKMYECIGNEAT